MSQEGWCNLEPGCELKCCSNFGLLGKVRRGDAIPWLFPGLMNIVVKFNVEVDIVEVSSKTRAPRGPQARNPGKVFPPMTWLFEPKSPPHKVLHLLSPQTASAGSLPSSEPVSHHVYCRVSLLRDLYSSIATDTICYDIQFKCSRSSRPTRQPNQPPTPSLH
jgi:hypothetical protein